MATAVGVDDDMPRRLWLGETLALIQRHYAKGLLSKVKLSRRILARTLIETSPWELIAAASCPWNYTRWMKARKDRCIWLKYQFHAYVIPSLKHMGRLKLNLNYMYIVFHGTFLSTSEWTVKVKRKTRGNFDAKCIFQQQIFMYYFNVVHEKFLQRRLIRRIIETAMSREKRLWSVLLWISPRAHYSTQGGEF